MAELEARVTNMTLRELEALVERMIEARLAGWPTQLERRGQATPQVWQAILDNLIELPSDVPSPTQMLREEREQWYKNS